MKEKTTIITISKGQQITIPAAYRKGLNFHVGRKVQLVRKHNKIILQPIEEDLDHLFKNAKKIKPKYHLTAKQMDELIEHEISR